MANIDEPLTAQVRALSHDVVTVSHPYPVREDLGWIVLEGEMLNVELANGDLLTIDANLAKFNGGAPFIANEVTLYLAGREP